MTNQAVFYWDLSERERAALSREDVERFVDAELMTKGVLKARPPQLEPEPESLVKLSQRFLVKSAASDSWQRPRLLFRTEDDARKFLDLLPEHQHSFYSDGDTIEHGQTFSRTIAPISIIASEDYEAHKSSLQSAAAIRSANKKATEEQEQTVKAQDHALKGLWDDWQLQRTQDRRFRAVIATFEDYRRIANSADVALRFLLKVHTRSDVEAAAAWCGVELPSIDALDVAATPVAAPALPSLDDTSAPF